MKNLTIVLLSSALLLAGCGDDGGDPVDASASQEDASLNDDASSVDAPISADASVAAGTCSLDVDGDTRDLSSGLLMGQVAGALVSMSCSLSGEAISFMIVMTDGPGTYPCEDGVVVGMTEMGYGIGGGTTSWSSRNASMTNGSCSITVTNIPGAIGERLQGTFSGTLKRRVGAPTSPAEIVITNGVFDVERTL